MHTPDTFSESCLSYDDIPNSIFSKVKLTRTLLLTSLPRLVSIKSNDTGGRRGGRQGCSQRRGVQCPCPVLSFMYPLFSLILPLSINYAQLNTWTSSVALCTDSPNVIGAFRSQKGFASDSRSKQTSAIAAPFLPSSSIPLHFVMQLLFE